MVFSLAHFEDKVPAFSKSSLSPRVGVPSALVCLPWIEPGVVPFLPGTPLPRIVSQTRSPFLLFFFFFFFRFFPLRSRLFSDALSLY